MDSYQAPILIDDRHNVTNFDCDEPELNHYLQKFALTNSRSGSSKTYVVLRGIDVIAFYSIAASSVGVNEAPEAIIKGHARYPVPVVLLARLAVDSKEKGKGLGPALLREAFLRTLGVADSIGVRAVVVNAKNEEARSFYKKYGFLESPIDPYHLMLSIKDIKKNIGDL